MKRRGEAFLEEKHEIRVMKIQIPGGGDPKT